jgi:hypothetical protein
MNAKRLRKQKGFFRHHDAGFGGRENNDTKSSTLSTHSTVETFHSSSWEFPSAGGFSAGKQENFLSKLTASGEVFAGELTIV